MYSTKKYYELTICVLLAFSSFFVMADSGDPKQDLSKEDLIELQELESSMKSLLTEVTVLRARKKQATTRAAKKDIHSQIKEAKQELKAMEA